MAPRTVSFRWNKLDLSANVKRMHIFNRAAMLAAAQYIAPQAEAHMRTSARWTDQTGNARSGLRASVVVEDGGNRIAIVLFHSVSYGIWLETRWNGRYAIIRPTVQIYGSRTLRALSEKLGSPI